MAKKAARKATKTKKKADAGKKASISGVFIPAGIFLGMGIGWIFGYLVQGLFIGMGAGFLAFAIALLVMRK
jgi:F0F1-type ATP synthase assembly protein I